MSESVKTKIIKSRNDGLSKAGLRHCMEALAGSGVIIIPTDTVYGIACNAFDPHAIRKIYQLKGRHYTKPLPILLDSADQLPLVAREIPQEVYKMVEAFWPGPLTLVFKTAPIALNASKGKDTIAVRVPDHGVVRQLLHVARIPLAATSANLSGEVSIKEGKDAIQQFEGRVDVIVDGGHCHWGKESSVADATHYPFTLLRHGAISKQELTEKLNLS